MALSSRASEWSALGDVVPSQATSAGKVPPSSHETAAQKEAEVIRMIKQREYDDLPTDVTTEYGIRQIFDSMDSDGSGTLNREELKQVLIENDITTPAEERGRAEDEVERVMHEFDTDLNDTISFDEFRKMLREQHVRRAALYIEDGLSARTPHRLGQRNLWMHRLYRSKGWQRFVFMVCLIHMSVALFEKPGHMQFDQVPRVGTLSSIVLDHSGFRYVLLGVELGCIAVYFFDSYLYQGFRPRHSRGVDGAATSAWSIQGQCERDLWALARFVIAIAMTLDVFLAAVGVAMLRFTRVLRPLVLAARKRGVKEVLKNIVNTVPQQSKVLLAIFSVSTLWAFVGFLMFKKVDEESFGTVFRSVKTMMLVFLSASYNQQVAENKLSVAEYRAPAAVFFVSYLVLSNMFLLRLVTAVAFDSFQQFGRAERITVLSARKNALDRAFDLVASPTGEAALDDSAAPHEQNFHMSKTSFVEIMQLADTNTGGSSSWCRCFCFNLSCKTHNLQPAEKAQLLFGLADVDHDDTLSLTEFYSVCYLWRYARIQPAHTHERHCVKLGQRWVPSGSRIRFRDGHTWRRGVVENSVDGDRISVKPEDFVGTETGNLQTGLMANSMAECGPVEPLSEVCAADIRIALCDHPMLACEELLEHRVHLLCAGRQIRAFDLVMSICVLLNIVQLGYTATLDQRNVASIVAALTLLLAFCLETLIKALAWGWSKYKEHGAIIDVVTALAGILQFVLLIARRNIHAHVDEVLMILQALRVVKLLRIVAPAIFLSAKRVASHTLDHAYVFTLLLYIGAVFGQELFAGRLGHIKEDPEYAKWAALSHVFSFDDFASSILTLFEVSLVANWWIVMVAAAKAAGSPVQSQAFFFVFKVVLWVLYLPIFVGFIITAFSKINSQTQEDLSSGVRGGVVVELPAASASGSGGSASTPRPSTGAEAGVDAQESHAASSVFVPPRRFVIKVMTDVTNKLYGIDPAMTSLRRQVQQQQLHLEALAIERDRQEQTIAQMQAVLDQHGLTVDSIDGIDSSVEVHHLQLQSGSENQNQTRRQRQQLAGEEEEAAEADEPGLQRAVAIPTSIPFASARARRRLPKAFSSPGSSSCGSDRATEGLRRSTSVRPSAYSFTIPSTPTSGGIETLLSRSARELCPHNAMGEELASLS